MDAKRCVTHAQPSSGGRPDCLAVLCIELAAVRLTSIEACHICLPVKCWQPDMSHHQSSSSNRKMMQGFLNSCDESTHQHSSSNLHPGSGRCSTTVEGASGRPGQLCGETRRHLFRANLCESQPQETECAMMNADKATDGVD
jgi:hypothetical protein